MKRLLCALLIALPLAATPVISSANNLPLVQLPSMQQVFNVPMQVGFWDWLFGRGHGHGHGWGKGKGKGGAKAVPEINAAGAALAIGLMGGAVAIIRERRRRRK